MGDKLKGLLIFVSGVVIGSVVTHELVKTKYEKIANDEINEIREYYSKTASHDSEEDKNMKEEEEADDSFDDGTMTDYTKMANSYSNNSEKPDLKTLAKEVEEEEETEDGPHIIEPDEYGSFEDYFTVNLTLYSDGKLADDMDELVEDIEGTVGVENLKQIGKYEEDALHVRNDELKTDFEILRVLDKYYDLED